MATNSGAVWVLSIGDSIARGHNPTNAGIDGWRPGVAARLSKMLPNVTWTYVGKDSTGSSPWVSHSGVGSTSVPYHITDADTQYGLGNPINPSGIGVIRIALGANDAISGPGATYATNMASLIAKLHGLFPLAVFCIAQITHTNTSTLLEVEVQDMNLRLPAVVAAAQSAGITCVLEDPTDLLANQYSDSVHPSGVAITTDTLPAGVGYDRMKYVISRGIYRALGN